MAIPLTVNGVVYQYPERRDQDWGINATAWASAVTAVLTTFASPSLPTATAGQIRLGNTDSIEWRNAADTGNIKLFVDSDDVLYFQDNGGPLIDLVANAAGNVTGPLSSTDNALPRYDGVSGQVIQNSGVIVDDSDNITTPGSITASAVDLLLALVPIGTIIPHYDFNGALTLDPTYWVPCDGGVHTVGGVPRTTPDLSNRGLVGFGTEGGGDNNTAPWSTTPVGNANHQVNLAHTHTGPSHTHTVNAHTHTMAHDHDNGTLAASLDFDISEGRFYFDKTTNNFTADYRVGSISDDGATSSARTTSTNVTGDTGASSAANTGSASPATNAAGTGATGSAGSATQSVQNRAIPVRWYMRAK